jgi:Spy/CpxP family protein refolding chaperone
MKKMLITLSLVALVTTAFAWDGRGMNDGQKNWNAGERPCQRMQDNDMETCWEELELTDSQLEKMKEFRTAQRKEMIQLRTDIQLLNIDKRAALENRDFKTAKKLVSGIYDKKETIALKRIEHREKMWNLLTPEQQEKAKELMSERRKSYHRPMMQKPTMGQHHPGMGM